MANFARNINTTATVFGNNASAMMNVLTNNSVAAAAATAPNTPLNNKLYVWGLVLGVVMGLIYLIKRFVIEDSTLLDSFLAAFRVDQRSGTSEVAPPPIATGAAIAPAAVHPDTDAWCFVGEDMTGRYCVSVPSAKSCDAARTFRSRQDCEMVPAHALPAGVVAQQGTTMLPLLSSSGK
jgi:hypothetical protein